MKPTIRVATEADLPALVASLGQQEFFTDRFDRQQQGRGALLVAWLNATPVGDVYLWLEPADEPEVRERLPGVPLLQHLEVHPSHRNRRVGSSLLQTAEQRLRDSGHPRTALGVELDNHGAARLYRRRGYREWGHPPITISYDVVLPDGVRRRHSEVCQILVKDLDRRSSSGAP